MDSKSAYENFFFRLKDDKLLGFYDESKNSWEDSSTLKKGLIITNKADPICGEGVGFGVPIIMYPDQFIFSGTANFELKNRDLIKYFSIDSIPIKTWRDKIVLKNIIYRSFQARLANKYKACKNFRQLLNYMIKLQSLFGIKLSYQKIKSKGLIKVKYSFNKNNIRISVDNSGLFDKNYKRLMILNEQSADFDLYRDEFGTLRGKNIGAWEEINSEWVSLTNESLKLTFYLRNITGTKLYRGWECIKPRLNWAGFCYSLPPQKNPFNYTINIEHDSV